MVLLFTVRILRKYNTIYINTYIYNYVVAYLNLSCGNTKTTRNSTKFCHTIKKLNNQKFSNSVCKCAKNKHININFRINRITKLKSGSKCILFLVSYFICCFCFCFIFALRWLCRLYVAYG